MQHILDHVQFEPDRLQLLRRMRITPDSSDAVDVQSLMREAQQVARPKAMYRLAFVESSNADQVVVDGVTLISRVLATNVANTHRLFVYSATCGRELQEWATSIVDVLQRFCADTLQEMALRDATRALNAHIVQTYNPGPTSTMSPGSLADWPLTQQRPVFTLLGDTRAKIGVELTDSLLMVPFKSISGIRFPTEQRFESCMLCPRSDCPGRRAPYDPGLYGQRYSQAESIGDERAQAGG